MTDELNRDERVDSIRRKLLRTSAVIGGGLALGHLPYQRPAVKSFFGVRSAWAQPSAMPTCGTGVVMAVPASSGKTKAGTTKTAAFTVENTGPIPFDVTQVDFSNPNPGFTLASTLPATVNPGQTITLNAELTCTTAGTHQVTASITTTSANGTANCPSVDLSVECVLCCEVTADDPIEVPNCEFLTGAEEPPPPPSFMIENCGDVPFTIDGFTFSRDVGFSVFPIDPPMAVGSTLDPGDTATIGVEWCPDGCEPDEPATITIETTPDAQCPDVNVLGICFPGNLG